MGVGKLRLLLRWWRFLLGSLVQLLLFWTGQPPIRACCSERLMLDTHRTKRNERAQSTSGSFHPRVAPGARRSKADQNFNLRVLS